MATETSSPERHPSNTDLGVGEHVDAKFGEITLDATHVDPAMLPFTEACTGSSAGLLIAECAAWVELFDETKGSDWNMCKYRLDPCACNGSGFIACSNNHITALDFPNGNNMQGSLPESLKDLTELTRLSLPGNKLTGSIPASLKGLGKLTTLELYANELTGLVPELPWAQYTGYCWLCDGYVPGVTRTNSFACPLPPVRHRCCAHATAPCGQRHFTLR